jgi:hypothetical protein
MKHSLLALALLAAGTAHAQPPPAGTPITTLLEKRVPDELAAEGLVLSRRNLTLKVEQVGDQLIISLVDLSSGRVAASTKLDHIPTDREATVATVTHVAADLATQAAGAPVPVPVLVDDRSARDQRDLAEMKFERDRLHFGDVYIVSSGANHTVSTTRHWVAKRGDMGEELAPADFYHLVGRDDLADTYRHRQTFGIGATVVGCVAGFTGIALLATGPITAYGPVWTDTRTAGALALGGGLLLAGVGAWNLSHANAITEADARSLADGYNQNLRRQLGLPTVARTPLHDLKIAPYVGPGAGGVVVGATF